jgi:ABC-type glycerol-3-phosphate transport system permease component
MAVMLVLNREGRTIVICTFAGMVLVFSILSMKTFIPRVVFFFPLFEIMVNHGGRLFLLHSGW